MKQRTTPPDLNTTLDNFKAEIFRDMNCIKIGEVQSFDKATASAQVKIKIKEWTDIDTNKSIDYPVLNDVPVMILQGGGAWIEFPIKKGDPCLVFFNDRDIDIWWTSGNETTPNSLRRHDLSDCIALVGINPKSSALALTGSLGIVGGSHKMDFINDNQGMADLMNTMFSKIDDLFTQISGLITDLQSLVTVGGPTTQTIGPATIASLIARDVNLTTVKTDFTTLKTNFTQLLGS